MMQFQTLFKFNPAQTKTVFYVLSLGLVLFGFQNCIAPGFYSITEQSLEACIDETCDDYRKQTASCEFNGAIIRNGQSLKAYLSSNGTCESENRTCENGSLSGSYPYAFCTPGDVAPGACLFAGRTIKNGDRVTAYLNGSGNCDYELRICNNGVLSGSYPYSSCNSGSGQAHCLFNGQTIKHGAVVRAFQNSSVPQGQTCVEELRLCTNGVLSGSYDNPFCAVNVPRTCLFNNGVIPHNGTVTAYQTSTVPHGTTCKSQTRKCNNGALSGSYSYLSCNVGAPAHCMFGHSAVVHDQEITAFEASTVPYGEECKSQKRKCNNGTLTGSFMFPSCNVGQPKSCILDGRVYSHGNKMKAFKAPSEDGKCEELVRECFNGKLSGDENFKYVACSGSGGSDGSGGDTGEVGGSSNCGSNEIHVDGKCLAAYSKCTTTDKNRWKTLAKQGNARAHTAWLYCEFIGSYRSSTDFNNWYNFRKASPSQYCGMVLSNFLLSERCENGLGDEFTPVCYDSSERLVRQAYQMALGRQPVDKHDPNEDYYWYRRTELQIEVSLWHSFGAPDTLSRSMMYMLEMCKKNEFKNRHKDLF